MTDRELMKILQRFKDAPELGGDFDAELGWQRFAMDYGFCADTKPRSYGWREYADYYSWLLSHALVRPLTVGISTFLLIFGGWVVTVNAAFNTVPGDFLYPVKLATERVQLSFANNEQRVRLHAEFASRRLDEVLEISSSTREGKEIRVREAVESFKSEMASASAELETIDSPETAGNAAIAMDRKVDEYVAVLEQTQIDASLEVNQIEVDEAMTAAEQADQQMTEAIIESHEATRQQETAKYLESAFQADLVNIQNHRTLAIGRMDVIEALFKDVSVEAEKDYVAQIETMRPALRGFDGKIQEAMDLFAAGGFRRVLEIVNGLQETLSLVEGALAAMEVEITTAQEISAGVLDVSSEIPAETPCRVSSPCPDSKVDSAESGVSDTSIQ